MKPIKAFLAAMRLSLGLFKQFKKINFWLFHGIMAYFSLCNYQLYAELPTQGQVVSGNITIGETLNQMNIHQSTSHGIIDWSTFSIGKDNAVNFYQPHGGATLNRVTGSFQSYLQGQLNATGSVYLINPNGIVVGSDGKIKVGQDIYLSTMDITNEAFLRGTNPEFINRSTGNLINLGQIQSGRDTFLIGTTVHNQGRIQAGRTAGIAAGGAQAEIIIQDNPKNNAPRVQIRKKGISIGSPIGIDHQGIIEAANAEILSAGDIYGTAINLGPTGEVIVRGNANEPIARATLASEGGEIRVAGKIRAHNADGSGGKVSIHSGRGSTATPSQTLITADIDTHSSTTQGGYIEILGDHVAVYEKATLNASGAAGGGEILIGGDLQGSNPEIQNAQATFIGQETLIRANAIESGDGGKIIIWSDQATRMYGELSAEGGRQYGDGGFIEVSSKGSTLETETHIRASAKAYNGQAGTFLLDPPDLTISTSANNNVTSGPTFTATGTGANVNYTAITLLLNNGTSVVLTTGTSGPGNGDIIFSNSGVLNFSGNNTTLTLNAWRNIVVPTGVVVNLNGSTHTGQVVTFNADQGGALTNGQIQINGSLILDDNIDGFIANAESIQIDSPFFSTGSGTTTFTTTNGSLTINSGAALFSKASQFTMNINGGDLNMAQDGILNVDGQVLNINATGDILLGDTTLNLISSTPSSINANGSITIQNFLIADLDGQTFSLNAKEDINQNSTFYGIKIGSLTPGAHFKLIADSDNNNTGAVTLNDSLMTNITDDIKVEIEAAQNIVIGGSITTGSGDYLSIISKQGAVTMTPTSSIDTQASQLIIKARNNVDLQFILAYFLSSPSLIESQLGNINVNGDSYFELLSNTTLDFKAYQNFTLASGVQLWVSNTTPGGLLTIQADTGGTLSNGNVNINGTLLSDTISPIAAQIQGENITLGASAQIKDFRGIQAQAQVGNITLGANSLINTASNATHAILTASNNISMSDSATIDLTASNTLSLQAQNSITLGQAILKQTGTGSITIAATNGNILDASPATDITPNIQFQTAGPNATLSLTAGQNIGGTGNADIDIRALSNNQRIKANAGQNITIQESGSNQNTLNLHGIQSTQGNINITAQNITNLNITDDILRTNVSFNNNILVQNNSGNVALNAHVGTNTAPSQITVKANGNITQAAGKEIRAGGVNSSVELEATTATTPGNITGATGPYNALAIRNADSITARAGSTTVAGSGAYTTNGRLAIAHETNLPDTYVDELLGRNIIFTNRGPAGHTLYVDKVDTTVNTDSRVMILSGRDGAANTPANLLLNDLVISGNIGNYAPNRQFSHIFLAANQDVTIDPGVIVKTQPGGTIQVVADEAFPIAPQFGTGGLKNFGTLDAGSTGNVIIYGSSPDNTILGNIIAANGANPTTGKWYQADAGANAYNTDTGYTAAGAGSSPGAEYYKDQGAAASSAQYSSSVYNSSFNSSSNSASQSINVSSSNSSSLAFFNSSSNSSSLAFFNSSSNSSSLAFFNSSSNSSSNAFYNSSSNSSSNAFFNSSSNSSSNSTNASASASASNSASISISTSASISSSNSASQSSYNVSSNSSSVSASVSANNSSSNSSSQSFNNSSSNSSSQDFYNSSSNSSSQAFVNSSSNSSSNSFNNSSSNSSSQSFNNSSSNSSSNSFNNSSSNSSSQDFYNSSSNSSSNSTNASASISASNSASISISTSASISSSNSASQSSYNVSSNSSSVSASVSANNSSSNSSSQSFNNSSSNSSSQDFYNSSSNSSSQAFVNSSSNSSSNSFNNSSSNSSSQSFNNSSSNSSSQDFYNSSSNSSSQAFVNSSSNSSSNSFNNSSSNSSSQSFNNSSSNSSSQDFYNSSSNSSSQAFVNSSSNSSSFSFNNSSSNSSSFDFFNSSSVSYSSSNSPFAFTSSSQFQSSSVSVSTSLGISISVNQSSSQSFSSSYFSSQAPLITVANTGVAIEALKEFERRERAARALQGTFNEKVFDHDFYVSYQAIRGDNLSNVRLFERNGRIFAVEPMPYGVKIQNVSDFDVVGLFLEPRLGPPITERRILEAQDRYSRLRAEADRIFLKPDFAPRFQPSENEFRRRRGGK
jgi:hypothetical protein